MISYRHILYCTDYSEDAEIALAHAVELAQRHGARLHVLHCLASGHRYQPTETSEGQTNGHTVVDASPELLAQAERELKEHYQGRLEGVAHVVWAVRVGTPYVEILRYLREQPVDLVVMGAEGASAQGPTHYGSTVDQISRRSPKPVMAVRNPAKTFTL